MHRILVVLNLAAVLLALSVSPVAAAPADDDKVSVTVSIGGTQRGVGGRWTMMKARIGNPAEKDQSALIVVTPQGSQGTQYARQVTFPAGMIGECQWPVFVPKSDQPALDFSYIVLPGGPAGQQVQRKFAEEVVRSVTIVNPAHGGSPTTGYCGWVTTQEEVPRENAIIEALLSTMRTSVGESSMVSALPPTRLDGYPEALDPWNQLTVSTPDLQHYPDACDAIRVWVQRGGKALILVDQTGPEVVSALLGDALPLTVIDETSTNVIDLQVNPQTSELRMPTRRIQREFAEPVRLVRAMIEGGYVHWSMDGWPAVVELPLGRGQVLLSLISPEVHLQDNLNAAGQPDGLRVAASGDPIREALFGVVPEPSLVKPEVLTAVAANRVGYAVPSAGFAGSVMFGFTAVLLIAGLVAYRREQTGMLLWLVPGLAAAAVLPAVVVGAASRDVAPQTAIRQSVVHVSTGQTTLGMDGVTSVYCPDPVNLNVRMQDFALLTPLNEAAPGDVRRLLWTDRGIAEWQNLTQSTGIRDYRSRSLLRLSEPMRAVATFDDRGLVGQLNNSEDLNPADALIAGLSPDRLAVQIDADGTFRATPTDVLAPREFSVATLLSESQLAHSAVYSEIFSDAPKAEVFPDEPSLLYWTDAINSSIAIGGADTQHEAATLVVQPLTLTAPKAGSTVVIPPVFLPYRAIRDQAGGISSAYSNRQRRWSNVERAANSLLEFEIPEVCRPFDVTAAEVQIRIRAGSRTVRISGGSPDQLQLLETLNSPVGLFTVKYPAEALAQTAETGTAYLQISVSDADVENSDGVTAAERDDDWRIERVLLTVQGERLE